MLHIIPPPHHHRGRHWVHNETSEIIPEERAVCGKGRRKQKNGEKKGRRSGSENLPVFPSFQ